MISREGPPAQGEENIADVFPFDCAGDPSSPCGASADTPASPYAVFEVDCATTRFYFPIEWISLSFVSGACPVPERSDWYGAVAQLVEHLLCKQGVRSSSLLSSTIRRFAPRGKPIKFELALTNEVRT